MDNATLALSQLTENELDGSNLAWTLKQLPETCGDRYADDNPESTRSTAQQASSTRFFGYIDAGPCIAQVRRYSKDAAVWPPLWGIGKGSRLPGGTVDSVSQIFIRAFKNELFQQYFLVSQRPEMLAQHLMTLSKLMQRFTKDHALRRVEPTPAPSAAAAAAGGETAEAVALQALKLTIQLMAPSVLEMGEQRKIFYSALVMLIERSTDADGRVVGRKTSKKGKASKAGGSLFSGFGGFSTKKAKGRVGATLTTMLVVFTAAGALGAGTPWSSAAVLSAVVSVPLWAASDSSWTIFAA